MGFNLNITLEPGTILAQPLFLSKSCFTLLNPTELPLESLMSNISIVPFFNNSLSLIEGLFVLSESHIIVFGIFELSLLLVTIISYFLAGSTSNSALSVVPLAKVIYFPLIQTLPIFPSP